ncbi:MAG: hypothetical protein H0U79_04375, partial [Solirubrobacterales bacterium]|nr:hypothetical protein [Solirubrobacterales bacterium]
MPNRIVGHARPRISKKLTALALAAAVTAPAALAASASAHGLEGTQIPEQKLRKLETALLGPAHAADHAGNRRSLRSTARLGKTAAGRRRIAMAQRATKTRRVEGNPADVGQWGGPVKFIAEASGAVGINAVMLPTGKVLWFSYSTALGDKDVGRAVLWNPADQSFKVVPPPINPDTGAPVNIWCGGASLLANGHVLVTGGNVDNVVFDAKLAKGLNHVYTFNPFNEQWTRRENLAQGRWYPSQVLMPDGRTLIMEGLTADGNDTHNRDIEVFDPNAPLGQEISTIGTTAGNTPARYQGSPEYYPHLFWTPTGRIFVGGPAKDTFFFTNPMSSFGIGGFSATARGHTWGTGMLMPLQHDSASARVMQLGGMDLGAEGPSFKDANGKVNAISRRDADLYDER